MTKTFYLSFADDSGFLGAAVVDVTEEFAKEIKIEIDVRFPRHAEGAEWEAGAMRVAHLNGCNPGGEMLSVELPDDPRVAMYPKNKLMTKAELKAIDKQIKAIDKQIEAFSGTVKGES